MVKIGSGDLIEGISCTNKRNVLNPIYLILAIAFLFSTAIATAFTPNLVERSFKNLGDAINSKNASGEIHLIEIDAKSVQQLKQWPWPRSYYADLVDRLATAGVTQIIFDVDFSSHSDLQDDQAFAAAISRANGKVVLPTFKQEASSGQSQAEIENLPIEILRQNAFLGSVNVHPDKNGQVNTYPFGTTTDGTARPSLAALLADRNGTLGSEFVIDQSIEIDTIPRHSFADILAGRFDPNILKDKKVIIGATAIEIGDRYPTSRFGVIPGVIIQTLAAETLLADMTLPYWGPWPLLAITAFAIAVCVRKLSAHTAARRLALCIIVVALIVAPIMLHRYKIADADIVPAVLLIITYSILHYVFGLWQKISSAKSIDRDTGLPNFASWQMQRFDERLSTVIVVEIANFKEIISTLDDDSSADFVRSVANRLAIATAGTALFRIGSEQFCWSVSDRSAAEINHMIESAALLFNAPMQIGGRALRATVCFGVASGLSVEPATLSSKAALASKNAVKTGCRLIWHDDGLAKINDEALFIASALDEALASGQISVVYQPQFHPQSNRVISAEALVRWHHPEKGQISPTIFVPVLEQENQMEALTLYVLRQVVDELPKWNASGQSVSCAINVSATLLLNAAFTGSAIEIIRSSGIDPALITIELTETAALASLEQADYLFKRIRDFGLRVSIDDYGTGQSTLTYLKKFNADEVKIDQSFVRTMVGDPANKVMVKSTIEMAHALNMSVVAEGVEDVPTYAMLVQMGCDTIQGWHIGMPVTSDQFIKNWCHSANRKSGYGVQAA